VDYKETLDYLYRSLPVFHRTGPAAYKNNLDNTHRLMEYSGHPENSFPSVHIAGTNGKGSVSSMLSAVLTAAGYTTGLYTSPHLKDFTERIRINGQMIPRQYVVDWVQKRIPFLEELKPSFFETTVSLCFDYFRDSQPDIAIIETGLGGRLDSTNVILPLLSVITNISYDHMDLLGDTLTEIAKEKAGIIKPGVPCIIGKVLPEVKAVFEDSCRVNNASLISASNAWQYLSHRPRGNDAEWEFINSNTQESHTFITDLIGDYQKENIPIVLSAIDVLRTKGFSIPPEIVNEALSKVMALSGLKGRMQVLSQNPRMICDVAHNEAGLLYVMKQLKQLTEKNLHIVLGMVSDKDRSRILNILPPDAFYYFVKPDIPRGLDAEILKADANHRGLKGKHYASVKAGIDAAKKRVTTGDLIFIGGSTFVVAQALSDTE